MIYCFDIDGTICTNTDGEYGEAEPRREVIHHINELYQSGHRILLFTRVEEPVPNSRMVFGRKAESRR